MSIKTEDFKKNNSDARAADPSENVKTTDIEGLLVLERPTMGDERGFFREVLEKRDIESATGNKIEIVQWNHSRSRSGVIRGIHAEPWDKIVYCVHGSVLTVVVDLRVGSTTFGKVFSKELGGENMYALYIPQGVANSFCVLGQESADYSYLVTAYYEGKPTPAISWDDPLVTKQFGGWPVKNPTISDKDKNYPTLKEKFGGEVDFSNYPWLNL